MRVAWFWIGLGLCAIYLYGCLMPHPPSGPDMPQFDKFEHAFGFLVMSLWYGALFRHAWLRVLIGLSAFSAVSEVMQWLLTTTRSGDPLDWLAGTAGILVGLALLWITRVDWVARVERYVATTGN